MDTCPNCDAPVSGDFCAGCGQRHLDGPLTVRRFLAEIPSRLLSLDRGFLHTFVSMVKDPGAVPLDYVSGKRARYTSPLAYWLVAATAQLLSLGLMSGRFVSFVTASVEEQFARQPEVMAAYADLGIDDPVALFVDLSTTTMTSGYTYMGIFLAVAFGLLLRLFTSFKKPPFTVAEQMVFGLYIVGHWALITAILMPITLTVSPGFHSILGSLGYLVIAAVASTSFHQAGGKGAVMTVLAFVASFGAYMIVLLVAMMAQLLYHISQLA